MGNFLSPAPDCARRDAGADQFTNESPVTITGAGQSGPLTEEELRALQNQQQGTTSSTGITGAPGPLKAVADRLKNAVDDTIDRITKPLKPKAESGASRTAAIDRVLHETSAEGLPGVRMT